MLMMMMMNIKHVACKKISNQVLNFKLSLPPYFALHFLHDEQLHIEKKYHQQILDGLSIVGIKN